MSKFDFMNGKKIRAPKKPKVVKKVVKKKEVLPEVSPFSTWTPEPTMSWGRMLQELRSTNLSILLATSQDPCVRVMVDNVADLFCDRISFRRESNRVIMFLRRLDDQESIVDLLDGAGNLGSQRSDPNWTMPVICGISGPPGIYFAIKSAGEVFRPPWWKFWQRHDMTLVLGNEMIDIDAPLEIDDEQ